MDNNERSAGTATVVTVTGDITLNKGGDVLLKDKVQSLLQQGNDEAAARPRRRPRTWTAPGSASSCSFTPRRCIRAGR